MSENALDRNYLLELIARINTRDKQFTVCTETTRWKALREAEDIPLLERFIKSRKPDIKTTARYAIQYIKERNDL